MTVWDTIQAGEYVMFALAVILIIAACIWITCSVVARKRKRSYIGLMHRVTDNVEEGDLDNAARYCESKQTPGALVILAGIRRVGNPLGEIESALDFAIDSQKDRLNKPLIWLRLFSVTSPLIGFGGTLVGLTDRLRDLGNMEQPIDLAMICSETAPTIVTTVAGLVVGVFSLLALAALETSISGHTTRLKNLASDFLNLISKPS